MLAQHKWALAWGVGLLCGNPSLGSPTHPSRPLLSTKLLLLLQQLTESTQARGPAGLGGGD